MKRLLILFSAAIAIQLAIGGVAGAVATLDELLEQTRTARTKEAQVNAQREAEFKASHDKQAALLAQAVQERAAAEARSRELSAQYDANDKEIIQIDTLLRERAGNLGELFGVTRQVAGDAATALQQSLISGQFPEREDFLVTVFKSEELGFYSDEFEADDEAEDDEEER